MSVSVPSAGGAARDSNGAGTLCTLCHAAPAGQPRHGGGLVTGCGGGSATVFWRCPELLLHRVQRCFVCDEGHPRLRFSWLELRRGNNGPNQGTLESQSLLRVKPLLQIHNVCALQPFLFIVCKVTLT